MHHFIRYLRPRARGPMLVGSIAVTMLASRGAAAAAPNDLCGLASAAMVSAAIHAAVVRSEAPQSAAGCEYSIKDTGANAATNHAISMAGAMGGAPLDPQSQKMLSAFGNAVLGPSSDEEKKNARHAGEIPALVFSVENSSNAPQELKMNRDGQGRLGPVPSVPGVGDEAFESASSLIMARKGNKLIRFFYTQCPCTTQDIVSIAQKITAGL